MGTVIKDGAEGTRVMPPMMTKKLFKQLNDLGVYFAEHTALNNAVMDEMAKPYKLSPTRLRMVGFFSKLGVTNMYWNCNLEKNGAFENRFARPYQPEDVKSH